MAKIKIFECKDFVIEYDDDIKNFNISFEPFLDTRINELMQHEDEYELLTDIYNAVGDVIKEYKKLKKIE